MNTLSGAIPVQDLQHEVVEQLASDMEAPQNQPSPDMEGVEMEGGQDTGGSDDETEKKLLSYVASWKSKLRQIRLDKQALWDECWQLYRGVEDWSEKDEWQSKIFLPKSFAGIEQATSIIKRLLTSSKKPFYVEPINPDDLVMQARSQQMTDLVKVLLENANYSEEFLVGLKSGFITGVGVWKVWWGLAERERIRTERSQQFDTQTGQPVMNMQTIWEKILEGKLFVRAVDPYNFFWLPGSKMNEWVGTLEEMEVPKWELMEMASKGVFDEEKIKSLGNRRLDDAQQRRFLRFGERPRSEGQSETTNSVKITEYYGPIIKDDKVIERHGHILIANDDVVLKWGKNEYWHRKPPYVGFSPLGIPFRTEGVGLIEMVRSINKGLNKITNLAVDTQMYNLLPVFEVVPEVYENAEDFESGLTPGKVFRRNREMTGTPGINPIHFGDISQGSQLVSAALDRASQEGSLISEIQSAIPRYRGEQTATEIETKQANQDSFFGAMAGDIEAKAIKPIVQFAVDLALQFLGTANDPRLAKILGVGAQEFQGMSREEVLELIQGEYIVKVSGITEELEKAEVLQNLVQLMNIIGQNESWGIYLNRDQLLRRILEAFRPTIRDIDQIVADPEMIQARQAALDLKDAAPQVIQHAITQQQQDMDAAMQLQQMEIQQQGQELQQRQQQQAEIQATHDRIMQMLEFSLAKKQAENEAKQVIAPQGGTK